MFDYDKTFYVWLLQNILCLIITKLYFDKSLNQALCSHRTCKKLGRNGWLGISTIATESFIVLKFDWALVTRPLPPAITLLWASLLLIIAGWTLWHFYINRLLWHTEAKLASQEARREHAQHQNQQTHSSKHRSAAGAPNVRSRKRHDKL